MGPGEQDDRLRALAGSPEVQAFLGVPKTAVYIARRDGHILWASPSMKAVFGYDPASLVGRNAWEIFPAKEDLEMGAKASALLNEGDLVVWLPLLSADRSKAWYRMDCLNREGGVVLAFRREGDPAEQRFHYFGR
jgi:PAS domain-containing protein